MPLNRNLAGKDVEEPPPEYLAEIGRVIVRWNMLESYLDFTLIKLLGKDFTEGRALVLFIHTAIPQKLDILGALVSELLKSGPQYGWLEPLYNRASPLLKEAQRQRNTIIHAKWGVGVGGVLASTVTARGKLDMKQRSMSLEQIIAASNAIYEAAEALYEMAWNPKRNS